MTQDLQHLLDAIQEDGVKKAKEQAETVLREARDKASKIVQEAEDKAEKTRSEAKQDAERFEESARQALRQAARDVLIALGERFQTLLEHLVRQEVEANLDPEMLRRILEDLASQYLKRCLGDEVVELYMSEEDEKALAAFFTGKIREQAPKGVVVHATDRIHKGFHLSMRDEHIYHDFSGKAMAEEISARLRPRLQEIVREVAQNLETESPQEG